MCYYCVNGLPPKVKKIFDKVESISPDFEYSLGHIVYSDFNLQDENIHHCIDNFNNPYEVKFVVENNGLSKEQLEAELNGLYELMKLTREERQIDEFENWN